MSIITRALTEEQIEQFLREQHQSIESLRAQVKRDLSLIRADSRARRRARVRAQVLKGSISHRLAQL